MMKIYRRILNNIFSDLPRQELLWLIVPGKHMSLLASRRAAMIISRVHLVALLFAVLTILFIIPDLLVLPWSLASYLLIGRIAASLAFIGLLFSFGGSQRMRDAYFALILMYAIPTLFFMFSYHLLVNAELTGFASTITSIYAFLPLIMVAGLSMFPLAIMEGAIFAAPVLLIEVFSNLTRSDSAGINPIISNAWLLIVIAIVATLSGVSQLGFMIELVRTSLRDSLTGCFSRLSGTELLEIQFVLSTRGSSSLSIAFIDLDNFKSVNDNFGHEAGDAVLINAVAHMKASLRTCDMLARWGGEEFIIIMPNTCCEDAIIAIDRIRLNGFGKRPDNLQMTASIGVAERMDDQPENWKALVDLADQRMYAAKQGGKNRIVHSCSHHA